MKRSIIAKRLMYYLDYKCFSAREFVAKTHLCRERICRLSAKSHPGTFKKIAEAFPDLNMQWLKDPSPYIRLENMLIDEENSKTKDVIPEIINEKETDRVKRFNAAYEYLRYQKRLRTQRDLANIMGAAEANISSAKKGVQSVLTDRFLRRFNETFDNIFNLRWLLKGKGNMLNDCDSNDCDSNNCQPNKEMTWDIYKLLCAAYVKTQFEKDQTYLHKYEELRLSVNDSMLYDLFNKATEMVDMFEHPEEYEKKQKAYLKDKQEIDDKWAALFDEMHKNL